MSQPSFPFDDGGEVFEPLADDTGARNRRTLLGVGALGATALAAGAFLLLGGSGADDEELAAMGTPPAAAAPAAAGPVADGLPVPPAPPAAAAVQLGRNPFTPLLRAPAAGTPAGTTSAGTATAGAAPGGPPAPTGGSAGPPAVTDPAPPVVGPQLPAEGGEPGGGPGGGPGGEALPEEPSTVLLQRVTGSGTARSAVLVLDGVATTVEVGSSFGLAGDLQLVSVLEGPGDGQWTAVLRAGDSDPFDVVSGVPTRLP